MLVNRVLVEEIPNDAAPDLFEIRKHFTEQPDVVHRQQGVVYSLAILHHLQDQAARFRMMGQKTIGGEHPLPNGGQRCGIEAGFLAMRFRKRFDHVEWIRKIGRDADAARATDDRLFPKAGLAGDLACLQEIITHEIFSCLSALRIFVAESLGYLLLKLKRKNIEVPA